MKMKYYSQYGQDIFADKYFGKSKKGFFVDIGAHDGITGSNTYFLEKERGWKGICIEPIPEVFVKLNQNRQSININSCITQDSELVVFRRVYGYGEMLSGILHLMDNEHLERIEKDCKATGNNYIDIEVPGRNINNILCELNIKEVDFLSIDTEGAEFDIIKTIDFNTINITFLTIENNNNSEKIREYLSIRGYKCIKSVTDDFFIKSTESLFSLSLSVKIYKLRSILVNESLPFRSKIKLIAKLFLQ